MATINSCEIPINSFLRKYKDDIGFADCYVCEVSGIVSQAEFIEAFYTTRLFKIERMLLTYLAAKPATDFDAQQLATGKVATFSAWRVEQQSSAELLLADYTGRTRSWLMALPVKNQNTEPSTLLYFGSAVVARTSNRSQKPSLGLPFNALLGFHRLYSRLLLAAACKRVVTKIL